MWGPILGGFTILGVFLILTAWINGRSVKKYIGEKLDEGFRLIARLIVEENEKTRKEILEALKK